MSEHNKEHTQQELWDNEYRKIEGVVTSTRTTPSSSVVDFLKFIDEHQMPRGSKAIDLGSGAGRNSIYLAQQGYQVTAIDHSSGAIEKLKSKAQIEKLDGKISHFVGSIGTKLPMDDESFDIAVDVTATNSLNIQELKIFASEAWRVLRKNGLFMSYVMAEDDEYLAIAPDKDGFTIIPESGLRDRAISKQIIEETYSSWEILTLMKKYKDDVLYGKTYKRALWWLIAKKSNAT